ncbi:hypothetical protein [Candidatus Nitrosotenuis uzonensis]|uniref:Uncharacterized protein n=1 Tax=Candidatus Nitrosotenuis uzonensis TaxID=1407055 RepID=V6AVH8_9ARCH|nr:hypothetical protein [Candidatus Nitrosotenuis uzonensis]CDI06607.1 hypothetical protein NITUZ_60134 [Candidatus Nitrosotenuis uzonensis]
MFEDLVKEAIRAPSAEGASAIMQSSVPNEVQGFIPNLVAQLDQGADPSVVADEALNRTFDIVESTVLTDATAHVLDKFSDRIVNLLFGEPFLRVLEQAAMLVTNNIVPS